MSEITDVKHSKHLVYYCKYHVVWCTKYRRKVLNDNIEFRLKEILLDVCQETSSELLEMEVMPDHVHILLECDPTYGIKRLVGVMKGRSSRLLRQEFAALKSRLPTLWTHSCFIATVGDTPQVLVRQYIENQKGV